VADVSPAGLLDPLVNAFDKIMNALAQFDPGVVLKPDLMQPLGVARGDDDLGPFAPSKARGGQPDAFGATDHDDGLASEFAAEVKGCW